MLRYRQAQKLLTKCKDKRKGKLVAPSTRLILLRDKSYGIKYKDQMIVKIRKDKTFVVSKGDTEKLMILRRLREFSPARISVTKSGWFLNKFQKFYNGAIINSKGQVQLPVVFKQQSYSESECEICGQEDYDYCRCPLNRERYDNFVRQLSYHENDNAEDSNSYNSYYIRVYRRYIQRGLQGG